jgi:PII-like signaling protein
MKLEGEGLLARIFVGESDRWEGAPLYEAIVQRAREIGLAGATVIKGIEGFGAHNFIHTARILRLAEDLPIIIEIVDQRAKVEAFLPELDAMVAEGLVTLEPVQVILYRARDGASAQTH